jgi:urease accessory protein
MNNPRSIRMLLAALMTVASTSALAHPQAGAAAHFSLGFVHPFSGPDHILAMVAVGLWASQLGGSALWKVPLSFVAMMAVGGALGMAGVAVPLVELGTAGSVLVFGLLVTFGARLPVALGMALVGAFALFHGHAHGTEMPADAAGLGYGLGFILATALLHGAGVGVGLLAGRGMPARALRVAGAAVAVTGAVLLAGI